MSRLIKRLQCIKGHAHIDRPATGDKPRRLPGTILMIGAVILLFVALFGLSRVMSGVSVTADQILLLTDGLKSENEKLEGLGKSLSSVKSSLDVQLGDVQKSIFKLGTDIDNRINAFAQNSNDQYMNLKKSLKSNEDQLNGNAQDMKKLQASMDELRTKYNDLAAKMAELSAQKQQPAAGPVPPAPSATEGMQ